MTSDYQRKSHAANVWCSVAMLLGLFLCLIPAAVQAQTADVAVAMNATPSVQPGGTITYSITVSNLGPDIAPAVGFMVPLPAGLSFTSLSAPGGWSCTTPAVGFSGTVTCSNASIGPAENHAFGLVATVPSTASAETVYSAMATVSSGTPDPAPANNTATATTTVVAPPIVISPATLASGSIGSAYSQTLSASGGEGPYSYSLSAGSIPVGITLSSAGVLSGTPTSAGTYNFTVTATDSSAGGPYSGSRAYTLTIAAPTITLPLSSVPPATQNAAYSVSFGPASGGTAPYSYAVTAGALPAGLTLSPGTGTLSGTPTSSGTFNFTITVTDSSGGAGPYSGSHAYSLTVNPPAAPVASGRTLGVPYNSSGLAIDLSGSITGTYSSIAVSTAPSHGTTSISGSVVTYTPAAGYFGADSFSYTATGPGGTSTPALVSLTVATPTAPVAQPTSATVSAGSGGTTVDLSGLVTGIFTSASIASAPTHGTVNVSGIRITYVPVRGYGGPDSFTYTVTGPGGTSAPATISLTVEAAAISIANGAIGNGRVGAAYSQGFSAAGGTGPYTYALTAGSLPTGLTLSTSGVISGTPMAAGSFPVTVSATDANGYAGSRSFTLVVIQAVPSAPSLTANLLAGTTGRVDVTQGATGNPFTRATIVSLANVSAGNARFENGYQLAFTPAAAFTGTAVVTYTLSNAFGTSAPATVTFTVILRPDPTRDADVIGLVNAQTRAAQRFAANQMMNFNERLERLHAGHCITNSFGISISDTRGQAGDRDKDVPDFSVNRAASAPVNGLSGSPLQRQPTGSDEADAGSLCSNDGTFSARNFGFWTGGFVNFGSIGTSAQTSFDYTTIGISGGVDYRFNERFTAGLGFGFGSDESEIGTNGTHSNAAAYNIALYGGFRPVKGVFIDGVIGAGWMTFDTRRFAAAAGEYAFGDRDGQQVFGSVTAGYEYTNGALLLSPYARLNMSYSTLDRFAETGAGLFALRYGEQSVNTLTSFLGLRAEYKLPVAWGVVTPRARIEYGHDFHDSSLATLAYADWVGGPEYVLETDPADSDFLVVGLGADIAFDGSWTFGVDYRTAFGQSSDQQHLLQLKAGTKF